MIYLSLGTNLGDKPSNLKRAIELLSKEGFINAVSGYWSSDPWGFKSNNSFINIAVAITTEYSPIEFLNITKRIEKEMGRTAKSTDGYCDRIIDIDIIDYNGEVISTKELTLPHPHIEERKFVLYPLYEIAPNWEHAVTRKTIKKLIADCTDTGNCTKITEDK